VFFSGVGQDGVVFFAVVLDLHLADGAKSLSRPSMKGYMLMLAGFVYF
jgi:hypothetical protein